MEFQTFIDSLSKEHLEQTYRVSETVYKSFQQCSNDRNPLHTDSGFAQRKGYRDCVMYGNILNAFVSHFIGECLPSKDVVIHSQDISYKNPVYLDDELRFVAALDGIYESVNTLAFKFKFINQDNLVVAKGHVQIGIL